MAVLTQLVEEYNSFNTLSVAPIIDHITSEGGKILDLVECLAESLTHAEVEVRRKATGLLSEVMLGYPPGKMSEREVEHFIVFYCNRLHDHHSVQPVVLSGLLGLLSYQTVADQLIVKMLQSVFAEVHVQSLGQADRRNVFNLFHNLLQTRIDLLRSIAPDFLLGFIQAMDSESDPRNLVICFTNARIVIENINFDLFTEDLFEVLSCYFPIDFSPPKDEKFNITKDDLVLGLRSCFAAAKHFAPYAVPLFVEKLSSDIHGAKKDALLTFTACLKIYEPAPVENFINDIWLCTRKDFILSDDSDCSSLYLDFFKHLVQCLCKNPSLDYLMQVVEFLVKDTLLTLKDPEMAIADHCGDLLHCACNTSSATLSQIVDSVLPAVQSAFEKFPADKHRRILLNLTAKLFDIKNLPDELPNTLRTFSDYFVPMFYMFLENEDLLDAALNCLSKILQQSDFVDYDVCVKHTLVPALSRELNHDTLLAYRAVISQLARLDKTKFENLCLAEIKSRVNADTEAHVIEQCIHLLKYTADSEEFCEIIVTVLVENLHSFKGNEQVINLLLTSLKEIVQECGKVDYSSIYMSIVDFLLSADSKTETHLRNIMDLLILTYRKLPVDVFTEQLKLSSAKLLEASSAAIKKLVLCRVVFSQATPNNLDNGDFNVEDILSTLWKMSEFYENDFARECIGISFASILNKSTACNDQVEKYLSLIEENIVDDRSVFLLAWICKACVLNWSKVTAKCVEALIQCLCNDSTSSSAACHFSAVLDPYLNAFDTTSHAQVKLMYKQRFTQMTLPMLIDAYEQGGEAVKANVMTAISATLQCLSAHLLKKHLKQLIPLLMHSLATSRTLSVVTATLSTLGDILQTDSDSITPYIATLVPNLLTLTRNDHMNMRMLCLKTLAQVCGYPTHLLLPMQADVLRGLVPMLDDRKRLVRREAVKCANRWHLMAAS